MVSMLNYIIHNLNYKKPLQAFFVIKLKYVSCPGQDNKKPLAKLVELICLKQNDNSHAIMRLFKPNYA